MKLDFYVQLILTIIAGMATAIPLVIKLVQYIKTAVQEKNWAKIVSLILDYMAQAEELFETGAERKEWVMGMIEETAKNLEYDIDEEAISNLIDSLCEMSKKVNVSEVAVND